jgi:hypothetical protein
LLLLHIDCDFFASTREGAALSPCPRSNRRHRCFRSSDHAGSGSGAHHL